MIEVKGLTKFYNDKAIVNNISFTVDEWDIFWFVGHNGAWKTTTINMLTTLLEPTSWTAKLGGFDIIEDKYRVRKIIWYLPENVQMYGNLSVYENLKFFGELSWVKNVKNRIKEVLDFLEVDYLDKKINELSKWMRQRIWIAQAILHNPKILFLDEPNTWLDPLWMKQLRDIIIKLNKEQNMTIFMNTHLLWELWKIANKVGVLKYWELIFSGSINELNEKYPWSTLENIYLNLEKK